VRAIGSRGRVRLDRGNALSVTLVLVAGFHAFGRLEVFAVDLPCGRAHELVPGSDLERQRPPGLLRGLSPALVPLVQAAGTCASVTTATVSVRNFPSRYTSSPRPVCGRGLFCNHLS